MNFTNIITENQLDEWVRGNAEKAQGVIVELIWRLVAASSPNPKERRFPLGDSVGQPGPDGFLITDFGFDPYVPEGKSFWEIGTGIKAGDKATSDYNNLTTTIPEKVRLESTFIFVTPLSGRRDWHYTWKKDAQASWLDERQQRNEWQEIRIIDGTRLIDWLGYFPSVELWLGDKMNIPIKEIQTPDQHWANLKTIGEPPPLIPNVFLVNREAACEKLKEVFSGTLLQLKLDTRFPNQIVDFISAFISAMEEDKKVDVLGRCLIISGVEGWNTITTLNKAHILIADFDLDDVDPTGTKLLEKARRAGHAVIFAGLPGGIPHPNRVSIPDPKIYQIKEALEKAGYNEERARIIAQKSAGNLTSLLRCLQNLSLMPEWSQGTDAADLAIAELLGAWKEESNADREVVEKLSKKVYGECIEKMREIELRPGTPLIHRNGTWKFIPRYEGWYALGPRLYNEHLDLLKEIAIKVLKESDPQFELEPDERYAASIHGKVLNHSRLLRNGVAESLALLGSHPKALTSCSGGKAEATAFLTVKEILTNADWELWASLNDLLPLLAEAAPDAFLEAVENTLYSDPCPFDTLFKQEGSGITGRNYMTGLLWSLETLAWDSNYINRVFVILGQLAVKDPGGNWANRPANSLSTILLPWLPQTCAPLTKRKTAIALLLKELPDIGWKLLLDILPHTQQVSMGSRKPIWREIIPDDWSKKITQQEYREQIGSYSELMLSAVENNLSKLTELIVRLDYLPPPICDKLFTHLRSNTIRSMPQTERNQLWTELINLVSKHRKYSDAKWALKSEIVNEIEEIAKALAPESPIYYHQRLFSESDLDLFEEKGDYEEQRKELENRRQKAVNEVFKEGGVKAVLEFAKVVESPWRVGVALGLMENNEIDEKILPSKLESEIKSIVQFTGGFIKGKFRNRGWQWIDKIDISTWNPSQKGQFLSYLPFTSDTWERVTKHLGKDESLYWSKTDVNPYEAKEGLELAVDSLVKYKRPLEAIRCLWHIHYTNQPLDSQLAIRVLQAVLHSSSGVKHTMDIHAIVEVIKALQDNPDTNPDDLFQIEWSYLPLLNQHQDASPKLLEQRLADDPNFFCMVIRAVYRSKNEEHSTEDPIQQQKDIATNGYRLLHEWKTLPGSQKDGKFDGDKLTTWLNEVKKISTKSGHLEIALIMVGHVLIHAPPDPDGFLIHHSVASLLNAQDANDIRDGYRTALYNLRGVHGFSAGREEQSLAEKYLKQADEIESQGYFRLAITFRELAKMYKFDSERQASGFPFED